MSMKALVTSTVMAAMASGAMAQSLDPVRIEMFRSILAGNECTLTEGAAANILPRFDFTREETRAIVGALVAAGEVRLDGSTLNLIDGSCSSGNPVADLLAQSDVQQFIAVMAENSCTMTEADGEAVFTARGITKAQVGAVVGPMIQAGMATFEGGMLSVDSAYCSAPVVAATAPPPATNAPELDRSGMFGLSRVQGLVDAMAQNNCTLNMEVADGYLAEAGIEHSFASFIGRKMLSDGFASMVDGENLLLPAPYCVSANAPVMAEVPSPDAPGVDMAMVATLREIFLANSCRLAEDQMDALLPPAGFTRDNIKPVFGFLEANGEMGEDGSDLVFYSDACAAAPADVATASAPAPALDRSGMFGLSRVQSLVDVMAQNNCTLNMEVADGYLAEAGIEHSFATFIGRKMLSDGFASMVDGENLLLPAPYCISAGGATPVEDAPVEQSVDMTKVASLREIFLANSCRLTNDMFAIGPIGDSLINAGFTQQNILPILDYLYATDEVAGNGHDIFFVNEACSAAPVETPVEETGVDMAMVATMRQVFAENSCRLGSEQMDELLPSAGFTRENARPIFAYLQASDELSKVNGMWVLSADTCTAVNEPSASDIVARVQLTVIPGLSDESMQVVLAFNSVGCRIPVINTNGVFTAIGLSSADSLAGLEPLIASGQVTVSPSRSDFIMDPSICDPSNSVMSAASGTDVSEAEAIVPEAPAAPMMVENDGSPLGIFLSVAAQNSCTLDVTAAADPLAEAGLRMDQAYRIVDDLVMDGKASLSSDGAMVTLDPTMCAGTAQPVEQVQTPVAPAPPEVTTPVQTTVGSTDPRAGVLAMLAANGCEVTQANVAGLVDAAGLDFNDSMQILTQMMGSGEATSPDGGQTLQVGAPLCVAAGVEPMTPRETFINLIKQNNCSITAAEFSNLLPVNGLDAGTAFGMISELEAEGVITLPATRDVVTLSAEMCR